MTGHLSYDEYQQNVAHCVSPGGITVDVAKTTPAARFERTDSGWQAAPYRGLTIITPPFIDDPDNRVLYVNLADVQQQLVQDLGLDIVGLVPVSSFHITVTGLVSGDAYPPFEDASAREELFAQVRKAFANTAGLPAPVLRVVGLAAFGPMISAVLDFSHEADYRNVLRLRDAIYESTGSLRKASPYTAHVTLLYKTFAEDADKVRVSGVLQRHNTAIEWPRLPLFAMRRVELRSFPDMTHYVRDSDWPVYRFAPTH